MMKPNKSYQPKIETADKPPCGGSAARLEVSELKTYAPPIVITIDGERANEIENIEIDITFKEDK